MIAFISLLLIIHELGHFITALLLKVEVDKICIYPFGGIAKINIPLNFSIIKEFIILINGPIFQEITKIILVIIFPRYKELIITYHYSILIFNLLPIYPLDGGKIVNLLLSIIKPYKKSYKITIQISYLVTLLILLINISNIKINTIIMILFLIYKISIENKNIDLKYEKFLLERYINNYNFKGCKIINSKDKFYRSKRHLLKIDGKYDTEKEFLLKKYKKT